MVLLSQPASLPSPAPALNGKWQSLLKKHHTIAFPSSHCPCWAQPHEEAADRGTWGWGLHGASPLHRDPCSPPHRVLGGHLERSRARREPQSPTTSL